MEIKEFIENEVDSIKSQLSIAHDNGDKYQYINLSQMQNYYVWTNQQINEILRSLTDIDAVIVNMMISDNGRDIQRYAFLFKLIYK